MAKAFDEATGAFGGKVAVTASVPPEVEASGKFAIVTVGLDGVEYTGTSQLPAKRGASGRGRSGGHGDPRRAAQATDTTTGTPG